MELKEVERCCCVVRVSRASSAKKAVSCSGVFVQPHAGTVICTGLPFSRFLPSGFPSNGESCFLAPRSWSEQLQVRVSYLACHHEDARREEATPSRVKPTRQVRAVPARLLLLANCLEFRRAFLDVFRDADRWRFHGDEAEAEDAEMDKDARFLSWFAVLQTDEAATSDPGASVTWRVSSSLLKGSPVLACGSPFGSLCIDLFSSTLSRGIVSNLAGQDNAVILTDARCLPGTEGGGLFSVDGGGGDGARLVGLIVSPFGWKANEWIGLTLVCSVQVIFRSIAGCLGSGDPLQDVWLQRGGEPELHMSTTAQGSESARHPTVCFVDSGELWGSGVAVTPRLVLTCRHVVNGKSTVNLKFHHRDRVSNIQGAVLFSTKASSPYDLALVQLRGSVPETVIPQMSEIFDPGESVLVVGYGGLGRHCGPSLTGGILSKSISLNSRPVMLQTTCAVQAGASGGAVVRQRSGELLGIVSSNTRDLAAKVTYPHLNYSIPVTVFQRLLQRFQHTRDVNVFRTLDSPEKDVRRVWRLQSTHSKL